jgi:signal transduction histidine kinase
MVLTAFLAIVLTGVVASTVPVLSPQPLGYYLFASAAMLPFGLRSLVEGGDLFTSLGLLAVACVIVGAIACRNNHRTLRESIRLRFENLDLVEQLRRETEISEAARREAEEANAAKSKFLAAASHDLRQPAHAQGLFLEALSRTSLTSQQRELLDNARAVAESSAKMLDTLLDFSRIEAGVIDPQPQSFRLQPMFNKIEREFGPQADAKGLTYRSRETSLVVRSDPALVELILRNLVSNAIRYTEQGGLLVACRRRGGEAVVEVWDTGIGIAPQQQREVFREFQQLGNPERDRRKGLGLGLAIADGLARRMGHGLSLRSVPGRGSVFRLALPVSNVVPAALCGATPEDAPLHGARVLVIDDDEVVLAGMRYLLSGWGCQCETADSIEDALDAARRRVPDVIVSDCRLREQRTGVEAIAAVRELAGEMLPALLITGDTAPDRLREAQATGIPLLHKPVLPAQLRRGLVNALHKKIRKV